MSHCSSSNISASLKGEGLLIVVDGSVAKGLRSRPRGMLNMTLADDGRCWQMLLEQLLESLMRFGKNRGQVV